MGQGPTAFGVPAPGQPADRAATQPERHHRRTQGSPHCAAARRQRAQAAGVSPLVARRCRRRRGRGRQPERPRGRRLPGRPTAAGCLALALQHRRPDVRPRLRLRSRRRPARRARTVGSAKLVGRFHHRPLQRTCVLAGCRLTEGVRGAANWPPPPPPPRGAPTWPRRPPFGPSPPWPPPRRDHHVVVAVAQPGQIVYGQSARSGARQNADLGRRAADVGGPRPSARGRLRGRRRVTRASAIASRRSAHHRVRRGAALAARGRHRRARGDRGSAAPARSRNRQQQNRTGDKSVRHRTPRTLTLILPPSPPHEPLPGGEKRCRRAITPQRTEQPKGWLQTVLRGVA